MTIITLALLIAAFVLFVLAALPGCTTIHVEERDAKLRAVCVLSRCELPDSLETVCVLARCASRSNP